MAMGLHPASSGVEYCPDHHLQSVQLLLRAAFTLSAVGRAECRRLWLEYIFNVWDSQSDGACDIRPVRLRLHEYWRCATRRSEMRYLM